MTRRIASSGAGMLAIFFFRSLQRRIYSPERELAADRRGMDLCLRAGYAPAKCLYLFHILELISLDYGDLNAVYGLDPNSDQELSTEASVATKARIWLYQRQRGYLPLQDRLAELVRYTEHATGATGLTPQGAWRGSDPAFSITIDAMAQSARSFVPSDFDVPVTLETKEFRLRMLTVNDVVKDYEAVMTSVEHLKTIWPDGNWPDGLTLEQNLIDLGWHQKEFQIRRSFAYTVVTPSEARVTGCVYINPTPKHGYDAVVYLWARQSELEGGLEARLYAAVREWIEKAWPFEKVAYPGRDIDWAIWNSVPDE